MAEHTDTHTAESEAHDLSVVEDATSKDIFKEDDSKDHQPLTLEWCFGFNSSLPVHNISDGSRKMLFYVSGHTGVLLDCEANTQRLLRGHSHHITCTAVSGDRRWLVTADTGHDPLVIIWDSYTAVPVRSIFDQLDGGCSAVAMSSDAKFIAFMSSAPQQVLRVWDWTLESEQPICHCSINVDYGRQSHLTFHPTDSSQLVSNSEDCVVFYHWTGSCIKVHCTSVTDKDFNRPLGVFSQSAFVPCTDLAVTGSSEGNLIIWQDVTLRPEGAAQIEPQVKRPLKLMKVHEFSVTVVTTTLSLLVTGDSSREVKFFDSELKMLNWYEGEQNHGAAVSISFAHPSKHPRGDHFPVESTMSAKPFIAPDFSVSTANSVVVHFTTNGSQVDVVMDEHDAEIHALASHPNLPHLLVGSYSSKLKLWNHDSKEVVCVRRFKETNLIQCVAFDPSGRFVGVGFTNGLLAVLDSITLEDVCSPFRYSRDAITHVIFSHDSTYMATADLDMCVSVYVAEPEGSQPWSFFARHRAHYKKIQDIMFGVKLDSKAPRLLSLSSDRTIVEYDLSSSCVDDLKLLSTERIEQRALPTAMIWFPPITKESFILVSNDQFKLKLFNSTTKMCRKTLLGPTFGSTLNRIIVLPAPVKRDVEGQQIRRYLAYTTSDKVGLLILPHDGNPHNTQCLIAHPHHVSALCCSGDGHYLFTAGGADCIVNMWRVDTQSLEELSQLGGTDLEPFYSMLPGQREGEFFAELEEYFYYAQIRSQGAESVCKREVSTHIPVEQIPNVMRAIGFYPTEQEIEEMLNEVKFSRYIETKSNVSEIDLADFIKLYVNHRPAFGLSPSQIESAFKVLGERLGADQNWCIERTKFLTLLQDKGEHLTELELVESMMTLLGYSENPEVDGCFTEETEAALVNNVPERMSASDFTEKLLGLRT